MKYAQHPIAIEMSTAYGGAEREALREDIHRNGLQHPIILYEGKVLDGWERYIASLAAGAQPRFQHYSGDDPLAFVFSSNFVRRTLTSAQKVLAAARYYLASREMAEPPSQASVAKIAGCSLERLNKLCRFLREEGCAASQVIRRIEGGEDYASVAEILDPDSPVVVQSFARKLPEPARTDLQHALDALTEFEARLDTLEGRDRIRAIAAMEKLINKV